MQKMSKWTIFYLDSAYQVSGPVFGCLCLFAMWHIAVMTGESSNKSNMVELWWWEMDVNFRGSGMLYSTCGSQYKHGGSPIVFALSIRKKPFHWVSSTVLEWVTQRSCAIPIHAWFHDLARQNHSWPVMCWQQFLLLSGCWNRNLQRSLLNLHFYDAMSFGSHSWADKPCFARTLRGERPWLVTSTKLEWLEWFMWGKLSVWVEASHTYT